MNDSKFLMYFQNVHFKLIFEDKLEQFDNLKTNASRIQFLTAFCTDFQYDFDSELVKDLKSAEKLKFRGDKCLHEEINDQAVILYNEAIKICPQDTSEGKELYSNLIANRSEAFFNDGQHQKYLQDVAFLQKHGYQTKIITNKLLEATQSQSLLSLRQSEFKNTERSPKNVLYPALSNKLTIKHTNIMGRYVVASEDIKTGEILAVEHPYASVIKRKSNCGHCGTSSDQIYACEECQTIYCSLKCFEDAKIYHQYECAILLPLLDLVDFWLPLRMVTQRSFQQVINDTKLKKAEIYRTDDYYNVRQLVQHENKRSPDVMLHKSLIVTFFVQLLKKTGYFGRVNGTSSLSNDEIFIGELLFQYIEISKCNSHAIYTMHDGNDYKHCGVGLYPTVSLFNHSCDPSVEKYNVKNMMVVRSVKPIKAGDVVYDNYVPLYMYNTKTARQDKMADDYQFTCVCQACVEDWPLLTDMNTKNLSVLCGCGGSILFNVSKKMKNDLGLAICPKCQKKTNLQLVHGILMDLDKQVKKANKLFINGNYGKAQLIYANIIDTQLKYFAPPFVSLLTAQERLIDCFRYNGDTKT